MGGLVVAIDGPSASGKGTLARALAERLGLALLDTGAVYRRMALTALRAGLDPSDAAQVAPRAAELAAQVDFSTLSDPALRTEEVSQATSRVSAIPEVRALLVDLQRNFAKNPPALPTGQAARGAVLDGRDIGTVICPDAPVKLFVTASAEIRAHRRTKELQDKGLGATYDAVLREMQERDARDSGRAIAPTRPAEDAVVLDTTTLSAEEVLREALDVIRKRTGLTLS